MSKYARSALGQVVDFDLLAIKQQLSVTPTPVGVDARRKFIDEKNGIKTKQVIDTAAVTEEPAVAQQMASALSMAIDSAQESADAASEVIQPKSKSKG